MKAFFPKLLCLVVALVLVAVAAGPPGGGPMTFSQMDYVRPEVDHLPELSQACLDLAAEGASPDQIMDKFLPFYEQYVSFTDNYCLSFIHYSADTTDEYWTEEYEYCSGKIPLVQGAMDDLLYGLADSDQREALEDQRYLGEGFFDDYDGQSVWTEAYTALAEEETQLENRYYQLYSQSQDPFGEDYQEMAQIYVDLIHVRQDMALEAGHDSFQDYAYDYVYGRDYTADQARTYLEEIGRELSDLYGNLSAQVFEQGYAPSGREQTASYTRDMARQMGGVILEAYQTMDSYELYQLNTGASTTGTSFEMFLPGYGVPYVFVSATGTVRDQLTFTHEFGHFCNDYAAGGSAVGIDVAEVFSQGLEYLSLVYAPEGQALTQLKMADSLCVFVEQAAYAAFELEVYDLEDPTVEQVERVFQEVGETYGFDSWGFSKEMYVAIPHFFTEPGYVISYVVSNDAAMGIYQLELEGPGAGLALYQTALTTGQEALLGFLDECGLESPFTAGHVAKLRRTLEQALG